MKPHPFDNATLDGDGFGLLAAKKPGPLELLITEIGHDAAWRIMGELDPMVERIANRQARVAILRIAKVFGGYCVELDVMGALIANRGHGLSDEQTIAISKAHARRPAAIKAMADGMGEVIAILEGEKTDGMGEVVAILEGEKTKATLNGK